MMNWMYTEQQKECEIHIILHFHKTWWTINK